MKRKSLALILALVLLLSIISGCAEKEGSSLSSSASSSVQESSSSQSSEVAERTPVNMGLLKGPSGMGAAYLMEQDALEATKNDYNFSLAAEPTDIITRLASGELDIAAVPSNSAAALYNKTSGNVQIIALSTGSVLYILENGDSINDVADLRGKTIYATGQGANPEYVLNHILEENGLKVGTDVFVEFKTADELSTLMASGEIDICMLPVPAVTSVMLKNADVRIALDLTDEWAKVEPNSIITMGAVAARKDFIEKNPQAVADFLAEYEESINYVKDHADEAATLMEKYEILPSAAVAKAAIPNSSIIFFKGADIKTNLEGYLQVLFDADPTSVGGALPNEDFYYSE